jgi:hypothetical protein
MTEHTGANAQSITGVWQGTYCYPFGLGPVSFVATLIEAGSSLTGTTHEPGRLQPRRHVVRFSLGQPTRRRRRLCEDL